MICVVIMNMASHASNNKGEALGGTANCETVEEQMAIAAGARACIGSVEFGAFERAGPRLEAWAVANGVGLLVALLDLKYLWFLPVPKSMRLWPMHPNNNTISHHFYRQSVRLLRWRERTQFDLEFLSLVREIWSSHNLEDAKMEVYSSKPQGMITILTTLMDV